MGCLSFLFCNKKKEEDNSVISPLLDDENIDMQNKDLPKKREFALYLIKNDYKIFSQFLSEVQKLNDEQFTNLFKGNTDYKNFSSSDPKGFLQLVQKFEDNYELISEWYDKNQYYDIVGLIWKRNIIQNLKGKNEIEQDNILKSNGIDTTKWDSDFKNHFMSIINISQTKTLGERLKNYIEANYGDFDELIKSAENCKKSVAKNEDTTCGKYLISNLDTLMYNTLKQITPKFLKTFQEDFDSLPQNLKNSQENAAIKKMMKAGLTETKSKALLKEVMNKYEKEKFTGSHDFNIELKKIEKLSIKFNNGNIDELKFKDKAEIFFSNNMIKHAILGLSLVNLSYGILHLAQRLSDYNILKKEMKIRLDKIKLSFDEHKNKVGLIPLDIEEAVEYIKKLNKDFNDDQEQVRELIEDINSALDKVETERNKSIFQMVLSCGLSGLSIFAATVTKGTDKIEYASSSIANILAAGGGVADIIVTQKTISKLKNYLEEAVELEKNIKEQIEILKKKYDKLKSAHWS